MTYPQTATPNQTAAPVGLKRPGTLLALVVVGALSAVSALIGAIYLISNAGPIGEAMLNEILASDPSSLGLDSEMEALASLSGGEITDLKTALVDFGMWDTVLATATATVSLKGILVVVFSLPLLLWSLLAINGALYARILYTISAVFGLFANLAVVNDTLPAMARVTSGIAMAAIVLTVVLCWLPANGRFAKARKLAR
ncbi:hypothetical protein SAMN05421805_11755 [Saccharopolyspora antimicrobica]|uniref:Uncharacterized protein n=1 Tax=Saccharopolyspora antimicrobica TaxID=455193 RepID=A0A1I5I2I2_9PSEU|nr:hypothetical protein [Saccharopolyspora antimicrobica]RKT83084.1 hypothetical protein ATL45_1357 [Saccharopolyspora antimicrobica]SFO54579.1 hypothetical protein SAMN05421805_11755 [Saccharopolyspora antimicrobica]